MRKTQALQVSGRFEEQDKLSLPLAVVPGQFLPQLADTVGIFGHADDLIAARHKLPDSLVLGELPVPADAGRRFVLCRNDLIKRGVDRLNHAFPLRH